MSAPRRGGPARAGRSAMAVDGVGEDRFFGGHVVGEVTRYSDALLMFLLRARRPQRFGPRSETGSGITGREETENDEQFLAMLRRRMAALAENGRTGGDCSFSSIASS